LRPPAVRLVYSFFDTIVLPLGGAAQSYSASALLIRRRRFSRSPSILWAIFLVRDYSVVCTLSHRSINVKRTSSVSVYRPFLLPPCIFFPVGPLTFSTAVVGLHFHRRVWVRGCRFLRLLVSMILHKIMINVITIVLFLYYRCLECDIFFIYFIMSLPLSFSLFLHLHQEHRHAYTAVVCSYNVACVCVCVSLYVRACISYNLCVRVYVWAITHIHI
jgi:hypothetical protein